MSEAAVIDTSAADHAATADQPSAVSDDQQLISPSPHEPSTEQRTTSDTDSSPAAGVAELDAVAEPSSAAPSAADNGDTEDVDDAAVDGDEEDTATGAGVEAEAPEKEKDAAELELERYDALVRDAGEQQEQLSRAAEQTEADDDGAAASLDPLTLDPDAPATARTAALKVTSPSSTSAPFLLSSLSRAALPPPSDDAFLSSASAPSASLLDAVRAESEHLLSVNRTRQRQIALFLDAQRHSAHASASASASATEDAADGQAGGVRTDYVKLLGQLQSLWEELAAKQEKAEAHVAQLIAQLNAQDAKGEALAASLHAFQHEIARACVDRHGNPLNLKTLDKAISDEKGLNKTLAEVRLHYLTQQSRIDALTGRIREKEELAEGLHLIDFEQLKIENATLHEKIEERNDELYKLTKKKNAAVEVLTHVREKVWWVWEENCGLRGEVGEEEEGIQRRRGEMKRLKGERERLRRENEGLKVKEGFVGVDALVLDYERRKERVQEARRAVDDRKRQYEAVQRGIQGSKRPAGRREEAKEQTVAFGASGAGQTLAMTGSNRR